MSITYRPPFDEDDELDLRALYRKPRAGGSPQLDAAVRRTWHSGRSWHPVSYTHLDVYKRQALSHPAPAAPLSSLELIWW